MIRVYNASERHFNHNGLKILKPLLAEIYKEDNGDYYLDIEVFIDDIDWVLQGNIVTTNTPWGIQGFRLGNPEISNNVIKVRAKHLYFDSSNYIIEDAYPQNQTAGGALNWVLARTDQENPFTGSSDIGDIHSARYVRKTLEEVIASIVDTWGGHLERDNFNISIKQNIGLDRGVTIAYSKNLTEFKLVENWDNVITKLLPVGNDGIMLPEKYLLSDVQYDIPYTKTVAFSPSEGIDTEDEAAVINDLRIQAHLFLNTNKYPKVNYTVNSHIENVVDIGDTIQVIHNKSNTNLLTSVISVKYDCILNKFSSIQFGNFKNNLKGLIKSIGNQIEEVKVDGEIKYSALELALQESQTTIMKYLTVGHKYITENAIYFLDTPDPATAQNFMIISLGGIGFGHNGIDNGYVTAWTIDGKFNADFITTGTIRALNIESTNINNNNKFMVDAEGNMIANDAVLNNGTFSGNITGGTLDINNKFMVDSSGNMTANNASLVNGTFSGDITGSDITGSRFYSVGNDSDVKIENGHVTCGELGLLYSFIDKSVVALGDITTSRYTTLSAGRMTLTGSGAYLQINGSPVITVSTINSNSYPPSSHDHYALYDSGYQLNWAGNSCLFAWSGQDLGQSSYRWGTAYLSSAPSVSSDRNLKHDIEELPRVYKELILRLNPVRFKYNDGDSNRYHLGFISQEVEEVMQELGIDSQDFAGFIKSPIYEIMDDKGVYDTSSEITGYIYMLRYEEFISPTISLVQEQELKIKEQAEVLKQQESKLIDLEHRISKLEVA